MKSIISAGIGLVVLAAAVQPGGAADLPIYKEAPVVRPGPIYIETWSWNGFYVGLNGGYSWGRSATDAGFFRSPTGDGLFARNNRFNLNGGVLGGQIGVN